MSDPFVRKVCSSESGLLLPLLAQVQDLHVAAHPEIFHSRASVDERRAFLSDWLARDSIEALAAVSDDQVAVGYLIYEIQERDASVLKNASRVGFLHQIAVDEACRGRGVGTLLIEEMKSRLRRVGVRRLRSEYFAFNKASGSFLRSVGLRPLRITVDGAI